MSSPHLRLVYRVLLASFLLVPHLVAFLMARSASEVTREGRVLEAAPGFSTGAPFAAQAEVFSSQGKTIPSLASGRPCLAYQTSVRRSRERRTTGPDGKETLKKEQEMLAEYQDQVPDLELRFAAAKVPLVVGKAVRIPQPESSVFSQPPPFLEPEKRNGISAPGTSYVVSEAILHPGQSLFVAARLSGEGELQPHPELGRVFLFAGTRDDCLEHQRSLGRHLLWASYALVAFSLLACVGLTLGFRRALRASAR